MIEVAMFRVTGISPLLMHSPAGMQRTEGKLAGKKIPTPEEEAEAGAYRLASGQLYLQAIAFRSALLKGCIGQRIGKFGAASRVAAGVFAVEVECPLVHPSTGKPINDYVINTCRAVVQRQGVLRSRPEIKEWACDVAFEIDTDFVKVQHVADLFQAAGKIAGVGDWRPEKKGPYGRFTVELKSVI